MILKKDIPSSSRYESFYDVDDHRFIEIDHTISNEITKVVLWNRKDWERPEVTTFQACGVVYLENVCHGENNEVLDTNLLAMAENCFVEGAKDAA